MRQLVLLRHGQSDWNKKNLFTGWEDVPLSPEGLEEAREAGRRLARTGAGAPYTFDLAFTSLLKRAIQTLWLTLEEMDLMWIQVIRDWRLNERHYGKLTGLNKSETAQKYGEEQVHIWRRSYDERPPPFEAGEEGNPSLDRRYEELAELPMSEALSDVVDRMIPYWEQAIAPVLREGKRPIIAAHGNSLRALVMHLDGLSRDEVMGLNIPTGVPLIYELEDDLTPRRSFFLAGEDELEAAQKLVADQGKAG